MYESSLENEFELSLDGFQDDVRVACQVVIEWLQGQLLSSPNRLHTAQVASWLKLMEVYEEPEDDYDLIGVEVTLSNFLVMLPLLFLLRTAVYPDEPVIKPATESVLLN